MSLLCAIFFARADEASYVRNSGVYCSEAAFVELVFFPFSFFLFHVYAGQRRRFAGRWRPCRLTPSGTWQIFLAVACALDVPSNTPHTPCFALRPASMYSIV